MAINYVVDSHFRPYSFEERIKPYLLYKEAYDKADAAADELRKKASKFAYLAEVTEDDAPAKAIYEGYARDLKAQADDFSKHGLTAGNSRALRNLRSRYYDEIGQLERADELLQAEKDLRKAARAKGQQMLYADNDLRISSYLGNKTPNVYGIDAEDLRKEGELYAKNVSSGVYSDPEVDRINKNYLSILNTQGYSPETMQNWRNDLESLSVFSRAVEDVLKARGVTDNLTGADYERARQSVINGIMEGSIYKENRETRQDLNTLTADQAADNARQNRALILSENRAGVKWNPSTRSYDRDDPNEWMYTHEDENNPNSSPRTGIKEGAFPNGYTLNPTTGKLIKDTGNKPTPEKKKEISFNTNKEKSLLALNKTPDVFKNKNGFDVLVDNQNLHYSYLGAISRHGDKVHHGALGTDVPDRGWGFTSSSNVMSPWGNFSATSIDSEDLEGVRVLADNEETALLAGDPKFAKALDEEISRYLEDNGLDVDTPVDHVIIQVPNENGVEKNGYLIAVRTL